MTLLRPLHLLFSALTYALGVAIADYLGVTISASAFWLGLGWALLAQISMNLLAEVFVLPTNRSTDSSAPSASTCATDCSSSPSACSASRQVAPTSSTSRDVSTPPRSILLALSLLIVLAYAVPPLKLVRRGFGELLLAAHLGYVFPSLGFVLQSGDFHRLLPILALPVTALALAYFLVLDFPAFADDLKYERLTLLTRLTWQRAVPLHHGLVIAAFALLAAAPLLGVSLALVWPAFLAVPFAILQILMLRNIALGAPPLWKPLTFLAATLFALTSYLLTFSFFLR